jgi:hypothetical protein
MMLMNTDLREGTCLLVCGVGAVVCCAELRSVVCYNMRVINTDCARVRAC